MYDYSGEWAFTVGIPAKSGVSGVIYAVTEIGGFCIYSPALDEIGNSVRGVAFFTKLVASFPFHRYEAIPPELNNVGPRRRKVLSSREHLQVGLYAAAEGDLAEVQRVFCHGDVLVDDTDYDGRTMLHLAASSGHLDVVRFLVLLGANIDVQDRWSGTPLDDATRHGFLDVVKELEEVKRQKIEERASGEAKA